MESNCESATESQKEVTETIAKRGLSASVENESRIMFRNVFVCDDCEKRFTRLDNLRRHKTEIHGFKLACSTCKQAFTRLSTLRQHVLQFHKSVTSNNSNEIVSQSVMKMVSSENEKKQQPPERKTSKLKVQNEKRKFVGLKCKETSRKPVLDEHKSQGDPEQHPIASIYKKAFCEICQKGFSSNYNLKRHKEDVHGNGKPANRTSNNNGFCGACNKYFKRYDYFLLHMRQHHGPIAKREKFHCKTCNIFFSLPCSFRRHNRRFHSLPKQINENISRVGYLKTAVVYKKTSQKMSFRKRKNKLAIISEDAVLETQTSPEKSNKKGKKVSRSRGKAKSNSMIWMCPCDRAHHSKKAYLLHAENYHQDIYNAIRRELYPDDPQSDLEF